MEWVIMSDELMHEGKRGMHWGERRYQRKDGSWTPLGLRLRREREGVKGSKRKPSGDAQKRADRKNEIKNLKSKAELDTAKAAYKINKAQNKAAVQEARSKTNIVKDKAKAAANAVKNAAKEKIAERKAAKKEATAEEIIRSGDMKKVLQNKDKLTNEQLRAAADRMDLEQRLTRISDNKKQSGLDAYKRFADTVGTTANLTKNGISIYNNIASVMNTFFDKDMMIIKVGKEGGGEAGRMFGESRQSQSSSSNSSGGSSSSSSSSTSSTSNQSQSQSSNSSNRSSSSSSSSSSSTGSPIRPNEAVNERARQRAAEANEQRRQSQAQERAQEGFRAWRENTTPPRTVVTGTGTSRQQAESVAERHARERASAVDVESRNVVENEIMPLINDAYFRRRD